ncbi:EAL domain-containing protein [Pseudonocardia sp. RS010]|uniref:EAL domain-containing protein n=1 Tax=Pseudonocardia sp. RS010 TaxID=3385979 RepID=UPI00399F5D0F
MSGFGGQGEAADEPARSGVPDGAGADPTEEEGLLDGAGGSDGPDGAGPGDLPGPVRRADLRRADNRPPRPGQARFADRLARAISAPSGGPVPDQARPRASSSPGRPGLPEYEEQTEPEARTDPGAVRLVAPPEQVSGPHALPLEPPTTDAGGLRAVSPALRDAAFGTASLPPSALFGERLDVVPLPAEPAVVCDGAGRILRVNDAFLRLAGRPAHPLGLRLGGLLTGPDADARLLRADGTAVRVRVVRWELPADLHTVVLVELGERERGDRRWTAELERLARVGTWTFDLATACFWRSPSLEELYRDVGVVPDGPHGPVEGEQVAALCRALRTGSGPTDQHVELRLPGERVLSCRAGVERGPDGVPVRLAGMVRDVTAQRLAESGRHSARRFADLLSTVPAGVGLFDAAGRLTDANEAFCALLDRPAAELRGRTALDLTADAEPGPDTAALPGWLRRIPTGGGNGYRVPAVTLRRGDGTRVTAALAVTASTSAEGDPFWLVVATEVASAGVPREADTIVDELTGLPNRAAALDLVADLLAGPGGDRVAVVCGDLDDFARVNSALGHEAGDELLVGTAQRLRRELPAGCTPARLAGDEFVVICTDHDPVGGPEVLARRVAGLMGGTLSVHGRPVQVTATVGVATPDARPEDPVEAADLLRYAEVAMHEAKRTDRGGVATASPAVVGSADRQLELEGELRAALVEDRLALQYQPVVGPDGSVVSAEALVRWPHPERGTIPPGDFLPVAERAGMLRDLDLWVLRTAVNEAVTWPGHAAVAVNLAGLLPSEPGFLDEVTRIVSGSGLPWDRLILELVETGLVALPQAARDVMAELTARGVRFAVDDFGTGYSSLARLKELPTQTVKVDRAFVTGVGSDPADFAVARAVVDMARAMGRTTVAEGVETAEQFHVLRGLGVDAYQGWLFSRPLVPEDLRRVLAGGRLPTPARSAGA